MPLKTKFSQVLDLASLDVFIDTPANDNTYFDIQGLPERLGYGKHSFTITYKDPSNGPLLKDNSSIVFEFVDANGIVVFSELSDISDLSGAATAYIWIKKDPLGTYDEIVDGPLTLYIAGELGGVPDRYKDRRNLRSSFTFDVRKDFPNLSPIIFYDNDGVVASASFSESIEFDINSSVFKRSYINVSASHLYTQGGKVAYGEVSFRETASMSHDFKVLSQYPLDGETTVFEVDISGSEGLNPISHVYKNPIPKDIRRDTPVIFKLRFLDENKQPAQYYDQNRLNTNIEITSSIIIINGSPVIIEKDDNLLTGSLYIGGAVGKGFEQSGKSSAYLKTVDYKGFISASDGSASSGIMFWSGSVLSASGDEYEGVGLELHGGQDSSSFRFRSNPSLLEVKADTFFVGSRTTQFISGSGNQIEISSSGFHLTPEGTITASKFLFTGGTILGDVTIEADLSANQIATPSGGPYKAVINSAGYAKFVSASIGGFYIDDVSI